MAIKTIRTDDIDGTEGAEKVLFEVEGVEYKLDLNEENKKAFLEVLAPYIKAASDQVEVTASRAEVAEWARANGYKVADRGAIAFEVRKAYAKAH